MLCNCVSEGKRNALQDYQKTEGIRLVVMTPDSSHLTKSKKVSMAKCAKACSRNRRLPFTCRYVCSYGSSSSLIMLFTGDAQFFWFSRPPINALHTHVTAVLPWVNFCLKKLKKADHYILHSSPLASCSFPFLLILQSVPL